MKKYGRMNLNVITTPDELISIAEKLKESKRIVYEEKTGYDMVSETVMCNEMILSFHWKINHEQEQHIPE